MSNELSMTISIDLKKMRLRIYKKVLYAMGEPKYIQLLVNPNAKQIAIRGIPEGESHKYAERISSLDMLSDNSVEFYSKEFLQNLSELVDTLNFQCSYRLYGSFVNEQNMAVFSLDTLEEIESQEGEINAR